MRKPDLNLLPIVFALYDELSVSRAARVLGMSRVLTKYKHEVKGRLDFKGTGVDRDDCSRERDDHDNKKGHHDNDD